MKFRELFEVKKAMTKSRFEKHLEAGEHIQIGGDKNGTTLSLNSDGEWLINLDVSDFATVYGMYKKAFKDNTITNKPLLDV